MPDIPVLKRLLILRDDQLPFLDLDLTHRDNGEALDELCLMGPNGCGKSTLLARIHAFVTGTPLRIESGDGYFLGKFQLEGEDFYVARSFGGTFGHLFRPVIEEGDLWPRLAEDPPTCEEFLALAAGDLLPGALPERDGTVSLWLERAHNRIAGRPAPDFETFLRELLLERREAFHRFLRQAENREKTIAQVERDFEADSPHARQVLRETWDSLLAPANLRIDFSREENPFVSSDGETVPVRRLGESLSHLLLQTGLAATIDSDWLFLDTPETGLHPLLLSQLIPNFRTLSGSRPSRRIVATHSAEVAGTFPAESRLRLIPLPGGALCVERGIAPEGIGLDEILKHDFGVATTPTSGKARSGREERPIRLKRAICHSESEGELADLIDEAISFREG